jgi:hypothetical protein
MAKLPEHGTFEAGAGMPAARGASHFTLGVAKREGTGEYVGYLVLHAGENDALGMIIRPVEIDRLIGFLQKMRSDAYGPGAS